MELEKLIDILEEALEDATKVPFMSKAIVDKEDFFEMIKDIRLKIPEEVKEAQNKTMQNKEVQGNEVQNKEAANNAGKTMKEKNLEKKELMLKELVLEEPEFNLR